VFFENFVLYYGKKKKKKKKEEERKIVPSDTLHRAVANYTHTKQISPGVVLLRRFYVRVYRVYDETKRKT
jgi:hypothetical protein